VFVAYASRYGQALIDRRLFLPEAWAPIRPGAPKLACLRR
jgi:hypothetical protein